MGARSRPGDLIGVVDDTLSVSTDTEDPPQTTYGSVQRFSVLRGAGDGMNCTG